MRVLRKNSMEIWKPDYGPSIFVPKTGAIASGARQVLIAYNINLNTNDKKLANIIAGKIRTSGIISKDSDGNKILDNEGKTCKDAGNVSILQAALVGCMMRIPRRSQ